MWQSNRQQQQQQQQQSSYGLPNEIGMVGFRDMFFVAPHSSTFHHQETPTLLNFDTHHINNNNNNSNVIGIGVMPILTTSPSLPPLDQGDLNPNHYREPKPNLIFPSGGGIGSCSSTTSISCRDCGNQAKKGCSFKRCRTCCKSRGFDCSTHVKSTWVPAARRRERQVIGVASGSSQSFSSSSKKPKVVLPSQNTAAAASHASTSNTTPPTSFESGSSHQADHRDDGKLYTAADGGYKEALPGQVRAPAVFKCVRVTAIDDGDDEYAYQATVKIGGHVFKGFLYDQGVAEGRDGIPNMSDLHLGGGGGGGGGGSSSSPNVNYHHSDVYALSGGQLFGGASTSYANPLN